MTNTSLLGVGLSIGCEHPNYADLGANIEAALARGVEYVELPLHRLDVVVGGRILRHRLAEVAKIVADRTSRTTLHGHLGINLMEDPHNLKLHLDVLKANIECAQALGSIHLVIHSGFCRPQMGSAVELAYERQREALRAVADMARDAGVVICVECIFTYDEARHTALPSRLAAELALINHPNIQATFDVSHGYIHCGRNGVDFLPEAIALAPFSKHLHLHDSFGRPKDFWTFSLTEDLAFGAGDLHLPMGWGSIPWEGLATGCAWPANLVADVEVSHRHAADFPAAIATSRAWVARLALITPG